jgi:hypothetical protein
MADRARRKGGSKRTIDGTDPLLTLVPNRLPLASTISPAAGFPTSKPGSLRDSAVQSVGESGVRAA